MRMPYRFFFIAFIQVIVTAIVTYFLMTNEYKELSSRNLATLESFLISQKESELKNYTDLALSSVKKLHKLVDKENEISVVSDIFQGLLYNGNDGYFFIYDQSGYGIVHPKEPFRIGQNWWDLEDGNGDKIIQSLLKTAENGGGFHRYVWNKPSSNVKEEKLGYATIIDKWGWMLGTGVYLDDVYLQLNKVQKEIDNHLNNTKGIIFSVAITSLLVIFIFGFIVNFKNKKQADEKISELGQRIITIQEEENRHIARELHDGIVQILVSIKFSLEATGRALKKDQHPKPEPLVVAEESLAVAINEIRRISHHMHPQILDELGLSSAIEAISTSFSERTGVKVELNLPAVRKLLPDDISTTLYRVVQEALINIEKHAQAEKVVINLDVKSIWLTLQIEDNGRGFDIDQSNIDCNGIGLRNLAERVEYHLGILNIHSDNRGTIIEAKIPTATFANYYNEKNHAT
ncbi:cache domain-containing protein [Thalassotalea sp. PLHSN55]|uniref:cache domain-containing protein n=1 Tax=Thalassotalea sp. PLHSN55 TaxID=3435888 RepID=UPI003F868721